MYLMDKKEGDAVKKAAVAGMPFGPGFSEEEAEKAATMETWASNANDPGEDFVEFRLLDADGNTFASKRAAGY
jgi:hypothetical protein